MPDVTPTEPEAEAPPAQVQLADFEGAGPAFAQAETGSNHLVVQPAGGGAAHRFPLDAVPTWLTDRYDALRDLVAEHKDAGAAVASRPLEDRMLRLEARVAALEDPATAAHPADLHPLEDTATVAHPADLHPLADPATQA